MSSLSDARPEAAPQTDKAQPGAPGRMAAMNMVSEAGDDAQEDGLAKISANPLAEAFSRKMAVHAGMGGLPVAPEDLAATAGRLRQTRRGEPGVAYVHLPYCESKCLYCGFFGGKYTEEAGAAYVEALIGEIEADKDLPCVASAPVRALYLGGGTPTALRAGELERLLRALRRSLPLADDCEITVEGRTHNFGRDKMEACLEAGANRFSLGVQSFNTRIRRGLGRISDQTATVRHLRELCSYERAAVVIDMIYGLPGQSLSDWEDDLRLFLDLPLDGVDIYQLNIFTGSPLAEAVESGRVRPAAPLSRQGEFFEKGALLLDKAGCRRLSSSHWGRTPRERNLYNPLVKSQADCLHYGAGAGGFLHGYFMANLRGVPQYIAQAREGAKPLAMLAAAAGHRAALRVILGQMELCRLNLDELGAALRSDRQNPPMDAYALYAPLLDNWQKAGLILMNGPWMELTIAGQFWNVNITRALIGRLRHINRERSQ
ncbi:MAG: heme anaerobic degradation radical SAM methyltransferase ChuW/HutW [Deltaproteobacteria bacterium]|jgi:oxygen-independent coproporphyrinogen-3 oxidase|nr:heme anaerobic degradation radical SAM methyltransferase ChuW/HutW [Deltaproteobacteria bacterium]